MEDHMIKAIITDDEVRSVETLRKLLEKYIARPLKWWQNVTVLPKRRSRSYCSSQTCFSWILPCRGKVVSTS